MSDKPRKRKAVPSEPAHERPPRDVPVFAENWPADAQLDELLQAFQRGDYAFVRVNAPRVAAESKDPLIQRAAKELRKRIDPDPVAATLVLVAFGLLFVLAAHYLGHRPESNAPTQQPAQQRELAPHPTST